MANWLKFSMGIKIGEVKVHMVWLHEVGGAPPEDVHISNLPLNANAHGKFDL